jgi:hypothetical protein
MVIVRGPISCVSIDARSARPISRSISLLRPLPPRPLRVVVERGSMAYSAVTQPRPLSLRNGGTLFSTEAVHKTQVSPARMSAEPSGSFR